MGNAAELTLPRRVQLAVIAHIRHEYTDYDSYLKTGSYIEARSRVEAECVDQLLKWRGEDDKEGSVELEESFRETIVIEDSEDEEDESDTITIGSDQGDRAPSLEIVTSRAQPQDLHANDVASAHWIDSHRDAARGPGVYYVRPRVRPATLQRPARRLIYAHAPQPLDERTAPAYAMPAFGHAQEQRYIEDRHALRPKIRYTSPLSKKSTKLSHGKANRGLYAIVSGRQGNSRRLWSLLRAGKYCPSIVYFCVLLASCRTPQLIAFRCPHNDPIQRRHDIFPRSR